MIKWIVVREDWPAKTGAPIAFLKCRYDIRAGLWYSEQSGGTYSIEEFAELEVCEEPAFRTKE